MYVSLLCFFVLFFSLYDKRRGFIFNTASVIFAVSDPEGKKKRERKQGSKKKKKINNGKAVRP